MRAKDFILREYSREKTVNVFGDKVLAALQNDKSHTIGGTALGTARAYLQQKAKINDPVEDSNKTVIINDIMHVIENSDPTPNKEYVQWLTKVYANQGIKLEDILSRGNSSLKTYHEFKVKKILPAEYRDIGRIDFAGLESIAQNLDLRNALAAKEEQEAAKTVDKGDAETVFENAAVRVVHPKNEAAACYYGQGTRWCTAATGGNNYFDRYNRSGPMYILLPKQPKYEGEKYQLHFDSSQFMDEGDNQVDNLAELLTDRFGKDLLAYFLEHEPTIKDWLEFAPDEVLKPLLSKIKQAVEDHLSERINEQEHDDEYWYEYLREKGYVYPEGHDEEGDIDWDAVADADESYTDWNYDAADFMQRIINDVDLSPQEVRNLAAELEGNGEGSQDIGDLEKILAYNIEQHTGRRDSDGGIPNWINERIFVRKQDGGWDVFTHYTDREGKGHFSPVEL